MPKSHWLRRALLDGENARTTRKITLLANEAKNNTNSARRVLREKVIDSRKALFTRSGIDKRILFAAERKLQEAIIEENILGHNSVLSSKAFFDFSRSISKAIESVVGKDKEFPEREVKKYISEVGWLLTDLIEERKKFVELRAKFEKR